MNVRSARGACFLAALLLPALAASCQPESQASPTPFDVVEATIPEMQQALEDGPASPPGSS